MRPHIFRGLSLTHTVQCVCDLYEMHIKSQVGTCLHTTSWLNSAYQHHLETRQYIHTYVQNICFSGKGGRNEDLQLKTILNWPWKNKFKLPIYVTTSRFCPQQNSCGSLGFPLDVDLCSSYTLDVSTRISGLLLFFISGLKNKPSPIWKSFLLHRMCYYLEQSRLLPCVCILVLQIEGINENSMVLLLWQISVP